MNKNEVAEYNRQEADDWAAWRAEEESIERVDDLSRGLEFVIEGRFDALTEALQAKCPALKQKTIKTSFGAVIELSF